jgi:hypothetical protein
LSEKNREVLMLRYLEQLTPGEIAAILGVSEGATVVESSSKNVAVSLELFVAQLTCRHLCLDQ